MAEMEGKRLNNKFYITFEKSQEDIPTLIIFTESWSLTGNNYKIQNVITGERAVQMWEELEGKCKKQKSII